MSRLKKGGAVVALALGLVGGFEGLRTTAYRDVVGIPTICYGETKNVRMGMSLDKATCDAMLIQRLDEFANGMERCVKRPMNDNVYTAFLSLSYNIGTYGFCKSTVVKRFNVGDHRGACDAMLMWDKAKGRKIAGLTRRREEERELCLKGM